MLSIVVSGVANQSQELSKGLSLDSHQLRDIKRNKKGGLDLTFIVQVYDHEREDTLKTAMTFSSEIPVHKDMEELFTRFSAHLAICTEQVKRNAKGLDARMKDATIGEKDDEVLSAIACNHVVLKGSRDDEDEKCMLFGFRRLTNKQVLNLSGSLIVLDPDKSDYADAVSLGLLIDELRDEVAMYVAGKRKAFLQTEIGFEVIDG